MKRKSIFFLLYFGVLGVGTFAGLTSDDKTNTDKNDEMVSSIRELLESKNIEEATRKMTVLDETHLVTLGYELEKSKKYHEAQLCYTVAINKESSKPKWEYYKLRADCFMKLNNWGEAATDFKKLTELNSDDVDGWYGYVCATIEAGKSVEVLEELRTNLNATKLYQLGLKCYTKNYPNYSKEALFFLDAAIEKEASNYLYHHIRGSLHYEMEEWGKALEDFKIASASDPNNNFLRLYVVKTLVDLERYDEAVEEMYIIVNNFKFDPDPRNRWKSKYRDELHYLDEVIDYVGNIIVSSPPRSLYYALRGECYFKMGEASEAVSDLKKSLDLEPNNKIYRSILVEALFEDRKYEKAVEEALALDEHQISSWGEKFLSYFLFIEALRCYNAAIDKNRTNANYYAKRGVCYAGLEKYELAAKNFQRSLTLYSNSVYGIPNKKTLIDLIEVLFEQGGQNKADEAFKKFVRKMGLKVLSEREKKRLKPFLEKMQDKSGLIE